MEEERGRDVEVGDDCEEERKWRGLRDLKGRNNRRGGKEDVHSHR